MYVYYKLECFTLLGFFWLEKLARDKHSSTLECLPLPGFSSLVWCLWVKP